MFSKNERLDRTEFTRYFKIGKRTQSENFTLFYSPASVLAVAVVVGKKVHKLAVDRNTLRRRVYATLRSVLDEKTGTVGIYIIISKPTAKIITQAAIAPEIKTLLATVLKSR